MFRKKKSEEPSELDSAWSDRQDEASDFPVDADYENWPAWEYHESPASTTDESTRAQEDGSWDSGGADLSGIDVVVADTQAPEDSQATFDADVRPEDAGHAAEDARVSDEDAPSIPEPPAYWDDDLADDDIEGDPAAFGSPAIPATTRAARRKGTGSHAAHASRTASKRQQTKNEKRQRLEDMPDHQRRSLRMRRVLIAVLVLILALAIVLGYLGYQFITASQQQLVQQKNDTDAASVEVDGQDADETALVTQKTQVPNLTGLFGLTQDEAIEAIGHGATIKTTADERGEDSAIETRVTLELSEEPGDSKSGTPTVYLGLNEDGKVVMAGYSAATASLGYGALSLVDIVENEHAIEHTLTDAGIIVEEGVAELPKDASTYQTYDTDGKTLMRESVDFDGEAADADGVAYAWSGVLAYDYTAANTSGNLADTVRQIYIYLEKK